MNACKTAMKMHQLQRIHFIDFGGGCGVLVPPLLSLAREEEIHIDVTVVDSPTNVELGRNEFTNHPNVKFYEQDKVDLAQICSGYDLDQVASILNLSGVLQYIRNYEEFLRFIILKTSPKLVCVNRFPRCENTNEDAFTIQNITTEFGFCGSTVVNLFGKVSLVRTMEELNFSLLNDEMDQNDFVDYFDKCSDEKYRKMSMRAYTFVNN